MKCVDVLSTKDLEIPLVYSHFSLVIRIAEI